jgi:hypothetical protein
MRCGLVLAFVLGACHAWAYDSECYLPGTQNDTCHAGPETAQNRWKGPSDEHRQLWERTVRLAGLPALDPTVGPTPLASSEFTLRIFTADALVAGGTGTALPTQTPVRFADTERLQFRTMSIGEFAQLPDFGYGLWDWATGLETCPLDSALPHPAPLDACHEFKTHMGAVNSNHFLPQARAFFAYYHQLALDRAAACKAMKDRIVARGAQRNLTRFSQFVVACDQEAFVLEAIGHHFLQDAWATGHMWERWGSPNLADYSGLPQALLVAMTSGLIHGARGVLQDALGFANYDVNDPLCAPAPSVTFTSALDPTPAKGLGDLYLDQLLTGNGANFPKQYLQLFSCTVAAVRQVSQALGVEPGPLDASLFAVADPTGDTCFGQRVTNRAMSTGIGLDYTDPGGVSHRIALDSLQATQLVPLASAAIGGDLTNVTPAVLAQYVFDLSKIVTRARITAVFDPDGTSLAQGGLGTLLGVERNANFIRQPLAPYVDPPLPWPDPATVANDAPARALALARSFHAAHATEWCNRFGAGAPDELDLELLRAHVDVVRSSGIGGDDLRAACVACNTFVFRHLRVGTDADHYDTTREPLCFYAADDPTRVQYEYQDGGPSDSIASLANQWCTCAAVPPPTTSTTVVTGTTLLPTTTQPPPTIPPCQCEPGFSCCGGHFCCF